MRWSGTTLEGWLGSNATPSNLDAGVPNNVVGGCYKSNAELVLFPCYV
jgi:hypothetical protein